MTEDITFITPEMRAILGKEYDRHSAYPISVSDIRRWAIAVYYPEAPPRLFWDEEYAAKTSFGGIVAPEEFNPFAWPVPEAVADSGGPTTSSDTLENRLGIKGPGLKFVLNGGEEVEYTSVRMRPGDVVTSVSAIVDYTEREGRLGRMLFTTLENRWTNQRGEPAKVSRRTLIRYGEGA